VSAEVLSLPLYPALPGRELDAIIEAVSAFAG
jgi:dTDP-4-amino-4,6-dideoxygalactose transaminase